MPIENNPMIKTYTALYRDAVAMAGSRRKACADAERVLSLAKGELVTAERKMEDLGDELLKLCRTDICRTCGRFMSGSPDDFTCDICDTPF